MEAQCERNAKIVLGNLLMTANIYIGSLGYIYTYVHTLSSHCLIGMRIFNADSYLSSMYYSPLLFPLFSKSPSLVKINLFWNQNCWTILYTKIWILLNLLVLKSLNKYIVKFLFCTSRNSFESLLESIYPHVICMCMCVCHLCMDKRQQMLLVCKKATATTFENC